MHGWKGKGKRRRRRKSICSSVELGWRMGSSVVPLLRLMQEGYLRLVVRTMIRRRRLWRGRWKVADYRWTLRKMKRLWSGRRLRILTISRPLNSINSPLYTLYAFLIHYLLQCRSKNPRPIAMRHLSYNSPSTPPDRSTYPTERWVCNRYSTFYKDFSIKQARSQKSVQVLLTPPPSPPQKK
jgi:hypothetical protein